MSAWIESHQTLRDHPKTRRLARSVGSLPAAIGHLHCLWWWCIDYAPDGDLSIFDDADIADAAEWDGDAGQFIEALTDAGFMTPDRHVHDWYDYAGRLIVRRERNRARMRAARGDSVQDTCTARAVHVQCTDEPVQATCDATQPNLTLQNQELKNLSSDSGESAGAKESRKQAKVSAPKDADWQARADELLEQTAFPSDYMRLAELLADRNKTGKAQVSRVVRELYEPLLHLEGEVSRDAMRAGLRAAIAKPAPNATYVKRAAESHSRSPGAVAVTSRTIDRSDFDDFYTGGEA